MKTPLGSELLGELRRVLGEQDREVLSVEDEQVPLLCGCKGGAVGGHRGGGGEEDAGRALGGDGTGNS